ncbi:MAG: RluA family pseudouridine synthase [Pirellulales bacterium]|nr:RluA family pseudouridine synthase [Pirellulales bacterium]
MSAEQIFYPSLPQVGKTISAALRAWLPGRPWSEIRQLIRGRRVLISGNLCQDEARRLTERDVVKILERSAPKPPDAGDLRLYYLDDHVCVVDKPARLTSNRHKEEELWSNKRKQRQPTLEELLPQVIAKLDPKLQRHKGVPPPVRPVHRLDRETTGLMVFARTASAESRLALQFREHTTQRRYVALVPGRVAAQTIVSHLVRDRGDGRRGSTPNKAVGKRSVTHIRPLEELPGYTLIECRLETGRTHQIRIHLGELGHPLCGEKVYNIPLHGPPRTDSSGARRVMLHARELGFVHPRTGEQLRFACDLPADFLELLQKLRKGPAG